MGFVDEPNVAHEVKFQTRGGDERRRAVAAWGSGAEAPSLVDLNDLGRVGETSRALSDGLRGRAFLGANGVATAEDRLLIVEGLSKGAGLALLAIPMAESFTLTQRSSSAPSANISSGHAMDTAAAAATLESSRVPR